MYAKMNVNDLSMSVLNFMSNKFENLMRNQNKSVTLK